MRTREQSLDNFCVLVDELIKSKYLFAGTKIFDVVTAINNSKLLSDIFRYFTEDFDFYNTFISSLKDNGAVKSFVLPEKNTTVIAFVYSLLREINYKNLQLTDLLNYFEDTKNYETAYSRFAESVLLPFKTYTYQIAMQMINYTGNSQPSNDVPETNADTSSVNQEAGIAAKKLEEKANDEIKINTAFFRLMDLDKLSIVQSHISKDDKEEMLYIWNTFYDTYKMGDSEKIKLAYLAYSYCLRLYRKVKTNLKDITDLLIQGGIL